jgi:hypothetical protein
MINLLNKVKEYVKLHVLAILVGVAVLSLGTAGYFYNEYSGLKQNPNKVAQDDVNKLVAQVSKLIVLPEGETPTVATVADPEKLKDQPFFAKAQKGDRVLIYTNHKKAILYNPKDNKIVEVAPINIGASATPAPTPKPVLKRFPTPTPVPVQ